MVLFFATTRPDSVNIFNESIPIVIKHYHFNIEYDQCHSCIMLYTARRSVTLFWWILNLLTKRVISYNLSPISYFLRPARPKVSTNDGVIYLLKLLVCSEQFLKPYFDKSYLANLFGVFFNRFNLYCFIYVFVCDVIYVLKYATLSLNALSVSSHDIIMGITATSSQILGVCLVK